MRKAFLLFCVAAIAAETLYFGRQATASLLRIQGERAFYRHDHPAAWRAYTRAADLGGDRELVELDRLELLIFGLDFQQAGLPVTPALPIEEALSRARVLATERIADLPYKSYYWGLAADAYFNQAFQARRQAPIDLSALTEAPLGNLLLDERIGIAALERAAALEPDSYLYHDLLARELIERGAIEEAAGHVRRAVAACPSLKAHPDLLRPDIDARIVHAAVQGFADARGREALIEPALIEQDAGRLLRLHGDAAQSIGFLQRAVALAPTLCEAHFELGVACSQVGDSSCAVRHLEQAGECDEDSPDSHYHLGLIHRAAGEAERALTEFRQARAEGGSSPKFFHSLGEVLESTGAVIEAERQFAAAAHLHPANSEAWRALLRFYSRHHDRAPLPEACERLEALTPGSAENRELCRSVGLDLQ